MKEGILENQEQKRPKNIIILLKENFLKIKTAIIARTQEI